MHKNGIKGNNHRLSWFSLVFILITCLFNSAYAAQEVVDGDNYEKALLAFQQQDYAAAIIHLKNNLQQSPEHVSSRVLLAENYLALNRGAEAEIELVAAQQAGVSITKVMPLLAQSYLLEKKYDAVLDLLPANNAEIEFKSDIFSFRGLAYLAKKDNILARSSFSEALQLSPINLNALLGYAKLHLALKQPELAISYLEKVLAIQPAKKAALLMAAITYQQLNNTTQALAVINNLLSLESDNFNARIIRAALYSSLGEQQLALTDLAVVTAKLPQEPLSNYLKMHVYSVLHNAEAQEVRQHLTDILAGLSEEIMASQPVYYFLSGLIAFQNKAYGKAESDLLKYYGQFPDDVKAMKLLARTEMALNDYNQAKKYLIRAYLVDEFDLEIWTLLGRVSMLLGDLTKSEYHFQQVLKAQPNNPQAKYDLAKLLLLMGKHHTLVKMFEKTLNNDELLNQLPEDMLFILAKSFQLTGDYLQGLKVAAILLLKSPNNSYAHQIMAALLGLKGDINAAYQSYVTAITLDENNFQALIHLARLEFAAGHSEQSIARLKQALAKQPNSAIMVELGNFYQKLNDLKNAQLFYQQALTLNPSSFLALEQVLHYYLVQGDLSQAIIQVETYINKYPNNPEAHLLAGQLYFKNKQTSKAVFSFENAIKNSVQKGENLFKLAQMQIQLGQRSSAVNSLQRAIAWEESYQPAYLLLINLFIEDANKEQALELIDKLANLSANISLVSRLKGDLFWRLGNENLANSYFLQSLKSQPNQAATLGLFRIYRKKQEHEKITQLLQAWLKEHPDDLLAAISLAENYRESGDKTKAATYYQALLTRFPKNIALLNNAAVIAIEMADYQQASSLINQVFAAAPKNINVMDTKAWLETQLGNYEVSLALLREANTLSYSNPEIKYHLAVTLDKMGRRAEAQAYLESALTSKQPFAEIKQAQLLLKQWQQK